MRDLARRVVGHACKALGHWTAAPPAAEGCALVVGSSSPTATCEERAHELELPGFSRRSFLTGLGALVAAAALPRFPGAPAGDFDSTLALWKDYADAQLMKPGQLVRVNGLTSTALGDLLKEIYSAKHIEMLQNLESPLWSRIVTTQESGFGYHIPVHADDERAFAEQYVQQPAPRPRTSNRHDRRHGRQRIARRTALFFPVEV